MALHLAVLKAMDRRKQHWTQRGWSDPYKRISRIKKKRGQEVGEWDEDVRRD